MKIATFNINNVNKRLVNLLAWLRSAQPDVACLQELKAAGQDFPKARLDGSAQRACSRAVRCWRAGGVGRRFQCGSD